MKLRKILFYASVAAGGAGFIAQGLEKQKRVRWGRVIWGVILALILIGIYVGSQIFGKAESYFLGHTDGCAVVFGAAVWKNDQPSWALSDRMQAGLNLYKNDQVGCLVLSGGKSTFGEHEVDVMLKIAQQAGVRSQDIYRDYQGMNTLATINNLPSEPKSFVFVSNDFHLARIGLIAQRKKVKEFWLHAAPYEQGRYVKNDQYFVREIGGYTLMFIGLWY